MTRLIFKGVFYVLFFILVSCNEAPNIPIVFEVTSNTNELNIDIPKNMEVYKWENHWLILAQKGDSSELMNSLRKIYPSSNITVYSQPFYRHDITQQCEQSYSKSYKRYIFTANLVADTSMQNAYMEYHKNQSKEWPEIAEGFCRAEFQQLLVYKQNRQLMLFIDIPGDKTLDELNPKTTENNPRMEEWNQLMSSYQEGIKDAPKGQVWVEFKRIKN